MSSQLDVIIDILRNVPEKKLLIIELVNKIPLKHGDFDIEVLKEMQTDIRLAVSEAKEYARHTNQAVEMIAKVSEKTLDPNIRNITTEEFIEGFEF